MDSCKILNVDAFSDIIIDICTEASEKSNNQAAEFVTLKIKQLIQDARNTNEPENQINLLKQALLEFYDSVKDKDEYGIYLSSVFPENSINRLLDSNYNSTLDQTLPASFAGMVNSSNKLKQDNFVEERFLNAPSTKLFFERLIKLDLVKTFLVNREKGKYYTTIEQINRNVLEYKQELLDRIFQYFDNSLFNNLILENVDRSLYKDGEYTGTLKKLTSIFDSKLDPRFFRDATGIKSLDSYYTDYKIKKSKAAKQFLDAYNAWIILQNFDTVVDIYFSSVIEISNENINQHNFNLNKYRLRTKSANKYLDWSLQEKELEDIGDVISDVTQLLIETSKRYQWKSDDAYTDRFLAFQDYNYIIGFIKKLIFSKDELKIDTLNIEEGRLHKSTEILIKEIQQLTGLEDISFKLMVALLNNNPLRYLPAIFDLLCNYLIEDGHISPTPSNVLKDLIWSIYKEIFQHDNNSLYDMHVKTPINKVYPTITQATISIFSEDRMQYYEEENNTFSTRLLSSYALENIKRSIFLNIQETALGLTQADLANLNIKGWSDKNNNERITNCKIIISNPELLNDFIITSTYDDENFDKSLDNSQYQLIWQSDSFQLLIKKLLGIDFQSNIDLAEAYLMQWDEESCYKNAVYNISVLLGRVAFTTKVNLLANSLKVKNQESKLHDFLKVLYPDITANLYINGINKSNGDIPVLSSNRILSSLNYLIEAYALNENTVTAPQAKTGEGTSISNYTLSCLHASYPYLIETLCKSKTSAVKDLTFVQNTNGMFGNTLSEREVKAFNTTSKAVDFSDTQAFQFDFLLSFIRSFIPSTGTKNVTLYGKCLITPTVNSDKSWLGKLEVFTTAQSHINNQDGSKKSYLQLTNGELEQEIKYELAPVYSNIFDNILKELLKIVLLFNPTIRITIDPNLTVEENRVSNTIRLLNILNDKFKNDTTLGNDTKTRILNGLSQLITTYNNTHVNNPIELADLIHYCFNADGLLLVNNTLLALWARTYNISNNGLKTYVDNLYPQDSEYRRVLPKNLLQGVSTLSSFLAYLDYKTIEDLLSINFKIRLWGSNDLVKHELPEIKFLRGDASIFQGFADSLILINACKYLGQNWVDEDGNMIIAKGIIDELEINIKTKKDLLQASSIVLHPMLAKFNRLGYLTSQLYTLATVGSHYIHGKFNKDVIQEESNRQLAANKRNNALTATIYLCLKNQLDGLPNTLKLAIMDDTTYDLYNVMGGMYYEGHKPMDGGMFANAFIPDLVNNSLNGEKVGSTQKLFGTFYNEKYAAGGTIKTASFPANNEKMRNYLPWRFLQQNMSDRVWVSEYDLDGANIEEKDLNITIDYLGNPINYSNVLSSSIYYKRDIPNSNQAASFILKGILYLGDNNYKITEHEVNAYGGEVLLDENNNPVEDVIREVHVNSNWKLYTEIFGGYNSLEIGKDGKLIWSDNSITLMQYAINNIGKVRKGEYENPITGKKEKLYYNPIHEKEALNDYIDSLNVGLDLQIVWQPLKYSDVHFIPNIGAIKSALFNVNYNVKEILSKPTTLNFFTIPLALFGVLLDKEHHADEGEVSFPTQIGTAIANRGFTDNMTKYSQAVSTLTRQLIEPYISSIQIENKGALIEKVSDLVVNNLIRSHKSINSILDPLVKKIKSGEKLNFQNDIKGKIGFSDRTIINLIFSILSSELTNSGIKLKLPGSLAVINPSDPVIHLYGDRLLGSLTLPTNESDNTRTLNEQTVLAKFQESVIQGNETDSYGDNMLIFDVKDTPIKLESESIQNYADRLTKMRLSNISKIKTLHNYIVKFADGHTEEITVNTPDQYFKLKNLITRKLYTTKPLKYDELFNLIYLRNLQNEDLSTTKEDILKQSELEALELYNLYVTYILDTYNLEPELYEEAYHTTYLVVKVYENVQKGRGLSAYNVQFQDDEGYAYQLYDLDSVSTLFTLNRLLEKPLKGYKSFSSLLSTEQLAVINSLLKSRSFLEIIPDIHLKLNEINPFKGNQNIPEIDKDFIKNLQNPEIISLIAADIERIARPRIYAKMQEDLFRLSPDYQGLDKAVYVNHVEVIPLKIRILPYEQIAPKMYKTQFGLDQFDDLLTILKDEYFFIKRGINRFACKLADHQYDFELKNFNGNHYYILKAEDIPQELSSNFIKPNTIQKGGKIYRTDHNGLIMYELSSDEDLIGYVGNVEVIITKNPLSYLQTLNFNTLKVSPKRVTDESYDLLIKALEASERVNSVNFLKAITKLEGRYLSLEEFKQFNIDLDSITYKNVKFLEDNKSIAQICKILNKTGREMHTSFKASLEMVAGRIPAQSQQSFMISKTVAFIDEDVNNVYVSPFQLFLQGSDLDIDAVTLIGYAFDMHGKFIGWSPYFQLTSTDLFEACKKIPLPTGEEKEVLYDKKKTNFFEIYSKYFDTLFKNSITDDGNLELNKDGSPVLYIDTYTAQGLELLAEFLEDFNKYGINIQADLTQQGKLNIENVEEFYKNGESLFNNLKGVKYEHVQSIMTLLLKFANRHNTYCILADEYAQKDMVKNFLSYYTYLTAANPANQTEAMDSIDASTLGVKALAAGIKEMKAPGNAISPRLSIIEGQEGKQGVGIGAVGIKVNSSILYYLRKVMKEGTEEDKKKILFSPVYINGKEYKGFANMYKDVTLSDDAYLQEVFAYIDQFTSEDQIPEDVSKNIAAMLSVAVDNAKDLVLGKINAGPKLMGLYIYGLAIGVPIEYLGKLMMSKLGLILKELTESSIFNNDNFSFNVLDVFKKLHGEIAQDLSKYDVYIKDTSGRTVSILYKNGNTIHKIKTPADALWAAMSSTEILQDLRNWNKNKPVKTFNKAIALAIQNRQFNNILMRVKDSIKTIRDNINSLQSIDENTRRNWNYSFNQMINFIKDIEQKHITFNSDGIGLELQNLARGASEMRILGLLLGINKGLKSSINDMEQFIETFENLIVNKKGKDATFEDKIDFKRFLLEKDYAEDMINKYESVKHSINIPHLISKVEYIKSYLLALAIPYYFLIENSIVYRTKRKYIQKADDKQKVNDLSIFKYFNVYDSTSKDLILAGLDNLIHYKLLTGWLSENNVSFEVPRSFLNLSGEGTVPISLHTPQGLIHFKKYMESDVLTQLQDTYSTNEFVKNLIKISNDKTPTHNTVTTLSLLGEDLLAKSGSPQAASNSLKFNDFRMFKMIEFQKDSKIPSIADAFYLYALFCYMGKKGKKSLMVLFDDLDVTLKKSFNEYIARLDHTDSTLELSIDEIKHWCAPLGGEWSNANYVIGSVKGQFGNRLLTKRGVSLNYNDEVDDDIDNREAILDNIGEIPEGVLLNPSKYISDSQEDSFISINKQHVLIPILDSNETKIPINNNKTNIVLSFDDKGIITDISKEGEEVKLPNLTGLQLPVIVDLINNQKLIDVGIIKTIIEQDQNCNN